MTTANLAEALTRLEKLRAETGDAVCVTLDVWLHQSGATTAEWRVWLSAGQRDFKAATMDAALRVAEEAVLIPTSGLPEVVLP